MNIVAPRVRLYSCDGTDLGLGGSQKRAYSRGAPAEAGLFFVLTFMWSWICWTALAISGLRPTAAPGLLLYVLGGIGPSTVAVALVVARGSSEQRKEFWSRVVSVRRVPIVWAMVALLVPEVLVLTALLCDHVTGGSPQDMLDTALQTLARPGPLASLVVTMLIGGALAEELGWRGYALDRLEARWSPLTATLVVGVVWALWHAPLFSVAGTPQAELGLLSTGAAVFMIWIVAQSFLFTWIYRHTQRSILVVILFHFATDFSGTLFSGFGHTLSLSAAAWRTAIYLLATAIVLLSWWPTRLSL